MNPKLGIATVLCVIAGLGVTGGRIYSVQNSRLPSWALFSTADVASIIVQGFGPSGNFVIHPTAGQSPALINSLVHQLPKDQSVKPHLTTTATGGARWLDVHLKNGFSIQFADFPNEPTPFQYIVTLTDKLGQEESNIMISDVFGGVTSIIRTISSRGVMVRQKTQ